MSATPHEQRRAMFEDIWKDYEEEEEIPNVEEILWRMKNGTWVAFFTTERGKVLRCQVDYCPFCGRLLGDDGHGH